jgi:regulator of protease activity HflC (stomatin/prohibitin superfamily)
MSSDRKDPNAIRRGSRNEDDNFYGTPPLQGQQDPGAVHPEIDFHDKSGSYYYEGDIEESAESLPTRLEVLAGTMRQLSPILAPLLFGGVTFLFILPFVLNNRAYLSTSGSLPTGLVLLAVGLVLLVFALGQGITLYYAGHNDVGHNDILWSLGMICGFSLFLLTGCFAIFGPIPTIILLAVLLLFGFLLARFCIRPTPEGQVDIVEALGKYSRTLFPGLNFVIPWEKIVYRLDTREQVWSCPMQKVPISRSEEVQLAATISYQLMPEDAHLAALYVRNWEKSLQELFIATIQAVVGELSPEDIIAGPHAPRSRQAAGNPNDVRGWDRINIILAQRMQEQIAHWGVRIVGVQIRDVALVPHIPLMAEANPPASTQLVNAGVARSAAQATPAQLNQAQAHSTINRGSTKAQPFPQKAEESRFIARSIVGSQAKSYPPEPPRAPAPSPAPAAPSAGTPTPAISKVDMLTDAYEAVRTGRITDPMTIREIAAHFESIANDPEESQNVYFDASRAARTLLERAALIEEQIRAEDDYGDETRPDWSMAPT